MVDPTRPEIIECEIRLHSGQPASGASSGSPTASEWSETAVGAPVVFQALADTAVGLWNGPLSPGVDISPPRALNEPWWTARLLGSTGVPIMCGAVGRPLAIGEAFTLPTGEPGIWTANVVFDGHVVTD